MIFIINMIIGVFGFRIEISDNKCEFPGCKSERMINNKCVFHHIQSSND